jgi:hypothetical protein
LKIVPLEIVQKAPLPIPQMRVLTDVEHHKAGDGLDIQEVQMGQPLRVEFSLQPETGKHLKNNTNFYKTQKRCIRFSGTKLCRS